MHPRFTAVFTIAKTWKQPKCPLTEEWIKKMEYYSAIKRKEITAFAATWMDLEIIMLSEVSQNERGKHHMLSLSMIISRSIHVAANAVLSFLIMAE